VALAGRVIASHYSEPLERVIAAPTPLRSAPSVEAEVIREIAPGDRFAVVDESLGWAWGYAGADGRVGYVPSDALSPQGTTERSQNS
jgi:hypothetical protein